MLFVVRKRQLQHAISVLRDDRRKSNHPGTLMRFEARHDFLAVSSWDAAAQIAATFYEPGVVFLRTKDLRQLLPTIRETQYLEIRVTDRELHLDNVRLALPPQDTLSFADGDAAPTCHDANARLSARGFPPRHGRQRQLRLWDDC